MGHNDLLASLAKCCSPVPGEKIIGYITRGRGVSVHSDSCPNVRNLLYDPERQIDVAWAGEKGAFYAIELDVVTDDRPGLLADLTQAIAGEGSNIRRIEARSAEDRKGYVSVSLETSDLKHLEKIVEPVEGGLRGPRGDPEVQRAEGGGERLRLGRGATVSRPAAALRATGRATGLTTLPDRRQREQARTLRVVPGATTARTDCRFRCHLRLVTLWAWLTFCPVIGIFPQK